MLLTSRRGGPGGRVSDPPWATSRPKLRTAAAEGTTARLVQRSLRGRSPQLSDTTIRETVREKYGAAAREAQKGNQANCGGGSDGCGCGSGPDPVTANLYHQSETDGLPEGAVLASLGCGNPTALAELKPGETVL